MNRNDLPVGFTMALSMNAEAMDQFSKLNDEEKQKIVDQSRCVNSKSEMQQLVNNIKALNN